MNGISVFLHQRGKEEFLVWLIQDCVITKNFVFPSSNKKSNYIEILLLFIFSNRRFFLFPRSTCIARFTKKAIIIFLTLKNYPNDNKHAKF